MKFIPIALYFKSTVLLFLLKRLVICCKNKQNGYSSPKKLWKTK